MAASNSLSETELKELGTVVGKTSWPPLATSVARIYLSVPNTDSESSSWQYSELWGAVILIVDRAHEAKPRLLQVWDLSTKSCVFSQELFVGMCYDHSAGYFHTFEVAVAAPECGLPASDLTTSRLVGLNFSDAKEAQTFGARVSAELNMLTEKLSIKPLDVSAPLESPHGLFGGFFKKVKRAIFPDTPKQVAPIISGPTEFKHTHHIGYTPDKGFDLDQVPADLKQIFRQSGIKKSDLQNPETSKMIYETVQASVSDLMGAIFQQSAPSQSALPAASSGNESNHVTTPSIPNNSAAPVPSRRPPPPQTPPPPPPVIVHAVSESDRDVENTEMLQQIHNLRVQIDQLADSNEQPVGPIVPTAGPPVGAGLPPPPVFDTPHSTTTSSTEGSVEPNSQSQSGARVDLMSALRVANGKAEKSLIPTPLPPPSVISSSEPAHLAAIRSGAFALRKAAPVASSRAQPIDSDDVPLVSHLRAKMAALRQSVMSNADDENDDDSDDW